MTSVSRLLGLPVATALLSASLLAGCSADDETPATAPTPSAASSGAAPYLPVPDGVELTEPGTQLSVGDRAVVAYHPRQGQVGALDIAVTRLEQTSIKAAFSAWQLSDDQKRSTPFYVHATVRNVGETDLGGRPVPLYVVNEQNVLLEATPFASAFKPCPSTPFPEKFRPGDKADVCLVYLAPNRGDLVAVSFRPEETFNPITWTGEVQEVRSAEQTAAKGERQAGRNGGKKDGKGPGDGNG